MKQLGLDMDLSTKKTRKDKILEEMERVAPWAAQAQGIDLARGGRGQARP